MYVTRPLSLYKNHPDLLSISPAAVEGPGSGFLVIQNEEDIEHVRSFFSREISKNLFLNDLPFPQNKLLTIVYATVTGPGPGGHTVKHKAFFIPVVNQPLSSNCYYVMIADPEHKGLAYTSATLEGTEPGCFCCRFDPETNPKGLNPRNIHQQFKIIKTSKRCFSANSVDPEGFPPMFLSKEWRIHAAETKAFIGEAEGLNSFLRSQLPDFNFPSSSDHSQSMIVGKWYCPYMFITEGTRKEQMDRSVFYELTLEQQWEKIYSCKRDEVGGDSVAVNVVVPTEVVKISWMDAVSERDDANETMWFWVMSEMGLQTRIGVSFLIVERIIWEQERVGWVGGNEKQVMVARMERYTRGNSWKMFRCYVLVERFVLRRLDGSLVLTYEFKHTHRIRCKWE
ncbi:uncharacterized protein LOC109135191 [Beta vulgaris subsp. vulgaris]|uniref:uncharacterized protein LOC109135191 n=1 Tax=Beta vulgaris subsp. vulgaris TaxID=3555 RepID=UPI00203681B8|nr:uncharacterized protein LOC109135191 [Beta vulgaris subsp. vulgaris]